MEEKQLTNKERMALPPQKMPEQEPEKRIHNVNEVPLGFTEEMAIAEAERCFRCKNAQCIKGCPVAIDIPGFIKLIGEKKFRESVNVLKASTILPAVCGRVCPQEEQCQKFC